MVRPFLFFILILFVASSCKNEKGNEFPADYTGFSEKEVVLKGTTRGSDNPDTIGKLFLKIPARLDTFYHWHRTSDCSNCGAFQYRYADRKYIQFAESGWFWTNHPDSVYQFTISHRPFPETPDDITLKQLTAIDTVFSERLAYELSTSNRISYLKKEFKEINGRGFVIAGFISPFGFLTNDTTLYLTAITQLKKRTLTFIAECGAKDTTGFIGNMYKVLMSVKIQEK